MCDAQSDETFYATLAEPLNFGHILEICGKVQQNASCVTINFGKLKTITNTANNIASPLQIALDFVEKQIKFKQLQSNNNNNNNTPHIITRELILCEFVNDFKFYVMLAETKFHVALNNKPLISFKYNNNLAQLEIQALGITGELEYVRQLDHHKYFPYVWPPIQIIEDYLDFSNDQPMPFKPGHVIKMQVRLAGNEKGRFIIQFRHGRDNKRQELHVSVRFDTKNIIRNSKCRQADDQLAFDDEEVDGFTFLFSRFGREEIDSVDNVFPFGDFHKPFKLAVAFCDREFRVAKDGKFLFNFCYRSPNVLQYITGPKMFGTNGVNVRVLAIEHLRLGDDGLCEGFEKYSL